MTEPIKIGDKVQDKYTGEYLGRVLQERVERHLYIDNGVGWLNEYNLEPSPKLTPEEAWLRVPVLMVEELKKHSNALGYVSSDDLSKIRHLCYQLLGGSGVKVTNEVKERVRKTLIALAALLDK